MCGERLNRDLYVSISGELLRRDRAGISPFDSVIQGGDEVGEGLRLYQGRIFRLTAHLDRLANSAKVLAFAKFPTHAEITEETCRTLEKNEMFDGVHIRLTTEGEVVIAK